MSQNTGRGDTYGNDRKMVNNNMVLIDMLSILVTIECESGDWILRRVIFLLISDVYRTILVCVVEFACGFEFEWVEN